ncbi:hypothetical protein EYF80_014879 [Liparis tanakae]|uniref:Uncharacterized protein n=1 Tax=Liparis tanakae TaxID=230148 RepID=A0A4Z2IB84_9TELE|nr:hypothetical protein EYF80_014879 [Liparis tanakae]
MRKEEPRRSFKSTVRPGGSFFGYFFCASGLTLGLEGKIRGGHQSHEIHLQGVINIHSDPTV